MGHVPRMLTRMPRARLTRREQPLAELDPAITTGLRVASIAGASLGAYHGYKRNHGSIGWALVWAFLGSAFPLITIPVALAQGFGKEE